MDDPPPHPTVPSSDGSTRLCPSCGEYKEKSCFRRLSSKCMPCKQTMSTLQCPSAPSTSTHTTLVPSVTPTHVMTTTHKMFSYGERRFMKVGMPPYGNCFFAGLAHQLGENPLDMGVIAKHQGELCDYIELNEEEMKPFLSYTADNNNDDNYENDCAMELAVQNSRFTEHCRTMRLVDEVEGVFSNHAWATNAEVQAASVVYGLNILIYEVASDGILRLYNSIGKKGDHEISLLYDGQHYDSLIPEADHTALTMEESMTTMHSTTTHSTLTPTTSSHTTLLPTTTRDDELMKSDKDEKEGCQTSGPNSLVAEDSGFEELGDSNVKQPAMTIADYCMQISKDDTFITPFENSVQGKLVDDETSARLIQRVRSFRETPSPIVQPRPEVADMVLQKAKDGLDDKTFLTCTIDPAACFRKPSNGHASVRHCPQAGSLFPTFELQDFV